MMQATADHGTLTQEHLAHTQGHGAVQRPGLPHLAPIAPFDMAARAGELSARRVVRSMRILLAQFVLMVLGFALTTSAFGIWMVAGTSGEAGMSLIKLGVSLFMLIVGMCLIVLSKSMGLRG